ncbi:BN3D2 methyltransferase, partial [Sakesphorus luctuosus]|nr:BN3D2 methyltransferase [Sakesphorus luctuosus]
DPGAAPYGNFPHYSRFHPPESRVRLLPPGLLRAVGTARPLLGIDVGCNSGELSFALFRHLLALPAGSSQRDAPGTGHSLHLLCCDIDPALIQRAQLSCPFPDSMSFSCLDFMDAGAREPLLRSHLRRFGRARFDLGVCLSVTMWIHLRHGDRGLRAFLAILAATCAFLLLEPQPWKCYRAAARRQRRAGTADLEHFRGLTIRGDVVGEIIGILTRECGMELVCCFGNTDWGRNLLLFRA